MSRWVRQHLIYLSFRSCYHFTTQIGYSWYQLVYYFSSIWLQLFWVVNKTVIDFIVEDIVHLHHYNDPITLSSNTFPKLPASAHVKIIKAIIKNGEQSYIDLMTKPPISIMFISEFWNRISHWFRRCLIWQQNWENVSHYKFVISKWWHLQIRIFYQFI